LTGDVGRDRGDAGRALLFYLMISITYSKHPLQTQRPAQHRFRTALEARTGAIRQTLLSAQPGSDYAISEAGGTGQPFVRQVYRTPFRSRNQAAVLWFNWPIFTGDAP
jgi:hypothetical protein